MYARFFTRTVDARLASNFREYLSDRFSTRYGEPGMAFGTLPGTSAPIPERTARFRSREAAGNKCNRRARGQFAEIAWISIAAGRRFALEVPCNARPLEVERSRAAGIRVYDSREA
jgi:hypothetical protein